MHTQGKGGVLATEAVEAHKAKAGSLATKAVGRHKAKAVSRKAVETQGNVTVVLLTNAE